MIVEDYERRLLSGEPLGDVLQSRDTDDRERVLDAFMVWLEYTPMLNTIDKIDDVVGVLNEQLSEYAHDQDFLDAIEAECHRRYASELYKGQGISGRLADGFYGPTMADGDGRYRLIEELGRGTQGHVYKAVDRQFTSSKRSVVALKVFHDIGRADGVRSNSVDHPNVVRVYDRGVDHHGKPSAYVVYEFLGGDTLHEWARSRRMKVREVAKLMVDLCDGVQAIHNSMIIHRDIKPANIVMDGQRPVIADFGIAVEGLSGQMPAGTPDFMSPEQLEGFGDTALVDIYGLGGVAYYLMTGSIPNGNDPVVVRHRGMRRVIQKCLEHDPGLRYQSAEGVSSDFRSIVSRRIPRHVLLMMAVILVLSGLSIQQQYDRRKTARRDFNSQRLIDHSRMGLESMILDMRLRNEEVDPAVFGAIVELAEDSDSVTWSYSALVSAEGAVMLRQEVEKRSALDDEPAIVVAYWWWLLARVEAEAGFEEPKVRSTYAMARSSFAELLGDDDLICLRIDDELDAWASGLD